MLPKEATRDKLKNKEVPALDQQLEEEESKLHEASKEAESVGTLEIFVVSVLTWVFVGCRRTAARQGSA